MKAKYILSIMALLIGASCSDDNENTPGFTLDEKEIQMEAVGGTREVHVSVPGNWTATPSESWVQVSPTNGKSSEICVIKVDTTILANKQREAIINFKTRNDAETRSLKIVQAGFDKALTLSTTSVELENYADYGKRYFDVEVTSNVDFKVTYHRMQPLGFLTININLRLTVAPAPAKPLSVSIGKEIRMLQIEKPKSTSS